MTASLRVRSPRSSAERRFFTGMALVVLLSTFIGFAPSYYLRGILPAPHPFEPLIPLVHLHGLVFSLWILLFAVQAGLVAADRTDLHRKLGLLGMVLIAVMIPLGIVAGFGGIARPLTAPPGNPPLSWAALPLLDVPVFGGLIIAALVKRRVPQTHKRLMLIAMVDMMQPSLGRTLFTLGFPGPVVGLSPIPFLLPLVIWDLRTRGTLHPATIWGSLIVIARLIITPMVWTTQWWMDFAAWGAALIG